MIRFRSVVFDADSTLASIEGIDWLAERRGADVVAQVRNWTSRAMDGALSLEEVYALRLEAIAPSRAEIGELGAEYLRTVAPGARQAVASLHHAGVDIYVVSGGIRDALLPLARSLDIADARVHAVSLNFHGNGDFAGVAPSPLSESGGKPRVVASLGLARPALAVGDGITDAEMRPEVDAFVAFTAFARRAAAVAAADGETQDFAALAAWILGEASALSSGG